MYLKHFELKEMPFSIAPDPRYLYMSPRHQDALAHLLYGLQGEGGIVLLTGEVGTGKTTLSRRLLSKNPKNIDYAWIVNPKLSVEELLATICDELDICYPSSDIGIKGFTDLITAKLIKTHAEGRNTVLMIDEAQNLTIEVLEQLRLLTNLETDQRKLLQIALFGQPELKAMLARHDMRQLSQRITARFHLIPLTRSETGAYIRHRLHTAGSDAPIFNERTVKLIYRASSGIPRLINQICSRAMLGLYAQNKISADATHIRRAVAEVTGEADGGIWWHKPVLISTAVVLLLVSVLALQTHQDSPLVTPASEIQSPIIPATTEANTPAQNKPLPPWGEVDAASSHAVAMQTLLSLWNPAIKARLSAGFCAAIEDYHYRCLQAHGDLNTLRRLNRPIVIPLGTKPTFFTLTAINGDAITLTLGSQAWDVPQTELMHYWHGGFTAMVQSSAANTEVMDAESLIAQEEQGDADSRANGPHLLHREGML